jgi:O-antigen/teichoic acid export membrane protein
MFLLPLILPLYLNKISMGYIATFQSIYTFLIPLISFNASAYLLRMYIKDDRRMSYIFKASILIAIYSFVIIILIFTIGHDYFFDIFKMPLFWMIGASFSVLTWQILSLFITYFQASNDVKLYAISILGRSVLMVVILFFLIIFFHLDWESRIESLIFADLIILIFLFYKLKKLFLFRIQFKRLKYYIIALISYGLPLIPHTMAMWILFSVDIFFINHYLGLEYSGVYYIGNMFALILGIYQDAIITAIAPYFFQNIASGKISKIKYYKFLFYFILSMILFIALLILCIPYILSFLYKNNYDNAIIIAQILLFGYLFNAIYKYIAIAIFYSKKTYLMLYSSFTAALSNILLNYLLIDKGIIGIAFSTTISFFISMVITILISNRLNKKLGFYK